MPTTSHISLEQNCQERLRLSVGLSLSQIYLIYEALAPIQLGIESQCSSIRCYRSVINFDSWINSLIMVKCSDRGFGATAPAK